MRTKIFTLFLLSAAALFFIASCKKDDNEPTKLIVKLGAQSNTTIGSFYSIGQNKVYTQDLAFTNQDTIDIFCFYEVTDKNPNYTTLGSAGANLNGVFTGETAPDFWTTKKLTKFTAPANAITAAEFDLLKQNDAVIETYFNSSLTSGYKKAKNLQADDIYAFKTQDNVYGLLKVISVVTGADGYVEFELKLKK